MSTARPRVPRAHEDPVLTPGDALAIITLARPFVAAAETIAFLLDDAYRGTGLITVVTDTTDPDSVVHIAEVMAEMGALSKASGRRPPTSSSPPSGRRAASRPTTSQRWCRASDVVESHGMTLLEWFVLGRSAWSAPVTSSASRTDGRADQGRRRASVGTARTRRVRHRTPPSAGRSPSLRGRQPQAGRAEAADELAALHELRAELEHLLR